MNNAIASTEHQPRRIGQSIGAFIAGFIVGVVLSLGTDIALHAAGIFPALGQPVSGGLLLLATAYRTFYGVIGSYVMARLAPYRHMQHALVGGAVGLVVSTIGAVATWNSGLGPHWYPLALIVLAMPSAWAGGRLREAQLGTHSVGK